MLLQSHHPFTSRRKLESILRKYEMSKPGQLLDPKDTGAEFIWPEVETKDSSQSTLEAPISDFAKELVSKV